MLSTRPVGYAKQFNASGLITSSTGFKGNGAQLTNLNASNISDGTLNVAYGGTGLNSLPLNQILIGNDTDPNYISKVNFKELGVDKRQIVTKLIQEKILPVNFYELS